MYVQLSKNQPHRKNQRPRRRAANEGCPLLADAEHVQFYETSADVSLQFLGFAGLLNGADIGAQTLELGDDVLIAPLNVLNAADFALTLGRQGGNDQRRAGPQGAPVRWSTPSTTAVLSST